jgi:hypothetical protein
MPGSLNDVAVVNTDMTSGVLPEGFFSDFADVPASHLFHDYVEIIFRRHVTAGCGGGAYCPDSPVTRGQMAVFLLRSRGEQGYVPPSCAGIFADVECPGNPFADWIEALYNEGITGGCGANNYCPTEPVTRAQMAALLLRTNYGSTYVPPACAGLFGDVPCPSLFADWIEELHAEEITAGCSASPLLFCPLVSVNRGQMAAFLVKTFELP